jgi:cytochrome c oxidase subunit 2
MGIRMSRRLMLAAAGAAALSACSSTAPAPGPRVIRIVARKYEFVPDRIEVVEGEAVLLEFTTPDVAMGFNVPDLSMRVDIVPGRVARLPFTAGSAGTFPFSCDVFCGSGHEDMSGVLVVT